MTDHNLNELYSIPRYKPPFASQVPLHPTIPKFAETIMELPEINGKIGKMQSIQIRW